MVFYDSKKIQPSRIGIKFENSVIPARTSDQFLRERGNLVNIVFYARFQANWEIRPDNRECGLVQA